ncbi:unnamed protein product [Ixodes pacificus]
MGYLHSIAKIVHSSREILATQIQSRILQWEILILSASVTTTQTKNIAEILAPKTSQRPPGGCWSRQSRADFLAPEYLWAVRSQQCRIKTVSQFDVSINTGLPILFC